MMLTPKLKESLSGRPIRLSNFVYRPCFAFIIFSDFDYHYPTLMNGQGTDFEVYDSLVPRVIS